jgi:hydroxymethylglutaryl-CoA reductase
MNLYMTENAVSNYLCVANDPVENGQEIFEMKDNRIIEGFSKLSKDEKLLLLSDSLKNPAHVESMLRSFWHSDPDRQKLFDEFSENTISNFYFPYGIAPNFLINGKMYMVPMVIEESSVIAAASSSAKFWAEKGGFHSEVLSTVKIGQVHFIWNGDIERLRITFPELKQMLIDRTRPLTANMVKRGGGILDIELVDLTSQLENYFQLKATFDTRDSMGANFINSCLEEFADIFRDYISESDQFNESDLNIIMSILSNYTPDCLVHSYVECDISECRDFDDNSSGDEFVYKFEKAVQIAQVDIHRATTHNKGIFNGIDAVALATGNDFRAIEACGHAYASKDGRYKSLSEISLKDGKFRYSLTVPLSMGTVGGLTSLHPLARLSLELLGNPGAPELMEIASCVGLANNFGALKSLTTKGIQRGHMKMHLLNILNVFDSDEEEKKQAIHHFKHEKVSYSSVSKFLAELRFQRQPR